jgi:zinc/manganese transport system substrate-binding protein
MKQETWGIVVISALSVLMLTACKPAASPNPSAGSAESSRDVRLPKMTAVKLAGSEKLRVVATTGIVGDVVAHVAGDVVQLTTLIGPGQDPHTYQPSPQDIAAIERAHVVFINGLGMEEGLQSTIDAAASNGQPIVSVSAGIKPRQAAENANAGTPAAFGEAHAHAAVDPHVWFDPANVKTWVANIQETLSTLDPNNAQTYQANAAAYTAEVNKLDAYIQAQVAKIPQARRKLVTDHESFGYFADRYSFQIVGAVIPSLSTAAEPSSAELASLITAIRAQGVPAVFVGTTTNPKLSDLVASETGARVLRLYTGELGPPGSGADTYIGMMRTDTDAIVAGLGQP